MVPYENDLWVLVPLMLGVFLGSLGFPVLMVLLATGLQGRNWTLHTKLTIQVSLILLVAGAVLWGAMEWDQPRHHRQHEPWGQDDALHLSPPS